MKKILFFLAVLIIQLALAFPLDVLDYYIVEPLVANFLGPIVFDVLTILGVINIFSIINIFLISGGGTNGPALLSFVIISAIWVFRDVKKFKKQGIDAWSPIGWTLLVFIFWIPVLTFYLTLRKFVLKKSDRQTLITSKAIRKQVFLSLGIVLVMVFISYLIVWYRPAVSLSTVLQDKEAYQDKYVCIKANYHSGFEISVLTDGQSSIWFSGRPTFLSMIRWRFSCKDGMDYCTLPVRACGIFQRGRPFGHFGMYTSRLISRAALREEQGFKEATEWFKADPDNDGVANDTEALLGTELDNADTDGDGYLDGEELVTGHDPLAKTSEEANIWKTIELRDGPIPFSIDIPAFWFVFHGPAYERGNVLYGLPYGSDGYFLGPKQKLSAGRVSAAINIMNIVELNFSLTPSWQVPLTKLHGDSFTKLFNEITVPGFQSLIVKSKNDILSIDLQPTSNPDALPPYTIGFTPRYSAKTPNNINKLFEETYQRIIKSVKLLNYEAAKIESVDNQIFTYKDKKAVTWKTYQDGEWGFKMRIPETWRVEFQEGGLGINAGFRIIDEESNEQMFLNIGPAEYFKPTIDEYAKEDFRILNIPPVNFSPVAAAKKELNIGGFRGIQQTAYYGENYKKKYIATYWQDNENKMRILEMRTDAENSGVDPEKLRNLETIYNIILSTFLFE